MSALVAAVPEGESTRSRPAFDRALSAPFCPPVLPGQGGQSRPGARDFASVPPFADDDPINVSDPTGLSVDWDYWGDLENWAHNDTVDGNQAPVHLMEGLAVGLGFVSFGFSAVGAFGVGADLLFSGDVALSAGDLGAIFGAASGSVDAGSCAAGVSVSCGLGVAAAGLGLAGVGLSLTATSAAAEAADASANAARLERAFTAAKFNLIPAAGEGVDPAALFASNAAGNAWGPAAVAAFNSSTRSLSLDAQLQGLSGIAALGGVAFVTPDIFNLAGRK